LLRIGLIVFSLQIIQRLHLLSIRRNDLRRCDLFSFKIKALYSCGPHQANNPLPGKPAMEHLTLLIAALPVSLILVIGSAWWVLRR
jgi:hypothetical protein